MAAGALIVAAGFSRRFGSDKRLYRAPNARPLLVETVARYSETFPTVAVVLRSDDSELARLLMQESTLRAPIIVPTAHAELGMGASLSDGIRAITAWDHVFIGLGDMPHVSVETLRLLRARMIKARRRGDRAIIQPCYEDRPGHPVGFSCEFFAGLIALTGDTGAKSVIAANEQARERVDVDDIGVIQDIDEPPATSSE